MDFHLQRPSLLLGLWEVSYAELLSFKIFSLTDRRDCSSELIFGKIASEDSNEDNFHELVYQNVAVNRVFWCPNGTCFGVAYSKNIVQIFSHSKGNKIQKTFECYAHKGTVNDLAFARPSGPLSIITCGDDRKIQVWNVSTGENTGSFLFHKSPVSCVCLNAWDKSDPLLISISEKGELVRYNYAAPSSTLGFTFPQLGYTKLICCPKSNRFFSCGTGRNGVPTLTEWNFKVAKHWPSQCYQVLQQHHHSVMSFGLSGTLLAVGDNHKIRFWDINQEVELEILTFDRDLPATPVLSLSKDMGLLAVEANGTSIKILASNAGLGWLSNLRSYQDLYKISLDTLIQSRSKPASKSGSKGGSNDPKDGHHKNYDRRNDKISKGKASQAFTDM